MEHCLVPQAEFLLKFADALLGGAGGVKRLLGGFRSHSPRTGSNILSSRPGITQKSSPSTLL